MTTSNDVSVTKPKYRRGESPASRANLKPPWKPGESPKQGGGYSVSQALNDILAGKTDGKPNPLLIAEKMFERSCILTGKSDSAILSQLLDRTEGKVKEEQSVQNINVVFLVGKGYQEIKELTQGTE